MLLLKAKETKGHVVARRMLFPTKQSPIKRKCLLDEICLFSKRLLRSLRSSQ
jgi:hypothetical protein